MKLKIYTDLDLVALGRPVDLLIPYVGTQNPEFKEGRLKENTFKNYSKNAELYFEFTDILECDVCLFPINYPTDDTTIQNEAIQGFLNKVEKSGKRIFIFLDTFIENYFVGVKNAIVFNRSISKSKQQSNLYSYPIFFEDYLKYYCNNSLVIAKKGPRPIVGFCGYTPPLGIKFGRAKVVSFLKLMANYVGVMKFFPAVSSHSFRARVLLSLKWSKGVIDNFRVKQQFAFGPSGQLNRGNTTETDQEFRRNFVNNITESDYTLGVRGLRNTSIRFYETMCCGKVPLFINTDCVLPFDFIIDWQKTIVWVDEKHIGSTPEILIDFHNKMSDAEFIALQRHMRNLWEEYLSPDGFFKNLRLFIEHQDKINPA